MSRQIDDASSAVTYSGNWGAYTNRNTSNSVDGTFHQINNGSGEVQVTFTGRSISIHGATYKDHYRHYCRIIDLDTPWFWFNASWTTTNSVVYKRTFCKVSGLDYGEHVVAMGGVAADAPQFISFDYALTSDTSNGSSIVWGSPFPIVKPPASHADTTRIVSLTPTSASSSAASSSLANSTSSTQSSSPSATSSSGLSTGSAIGVGVGVGVGVALLLALLAAYYFRRRQQRRKYWDNSTAGESKAAISSSRDPTPPNNTIAGSSSPSHTFAQTSPRMMSVPEITEYQTALGSDAPYTTYHGVVLPGAVGLEDPRSFARRD